MRPFLSALCLALIATPVLAGELNPIVHLSEAVCIKDLDLSTDAGAKKALARIEAAARRLCTESSPTQLLNSSRTYQACRAAAVRTTVAQTNHPILSRVYAEKVGGAQLAAR